MRFGLFAYLLIVQLVDAAALLLLPSVGLFFAFLLRDITSAWTRTLSLIVVVTGTMVGLLNVLTVFQNILMWVDVWRRLPPSIALDHIKIIQHFVQLEIWPAMLSSFVFYPSLILIGIAVFRFDRETWRRAVAMIVVVITSVIFIPMIGYNLLLGLLCSLPGHARCT